MQTTAVTRTAVALVAPINPANPLINPVGAMTTTTKTYRCEMCTRRVWHFASSC